jgi:hypothetical protein
VFLDLRLAESTGFELLPALPRRRRRRDRHRLRPLRGQGL